MNELQAIIPPSQEIIITIEQEEELSISLEKGECMPEPALPDLLLHYQLAKA